MDTQFNRPASPTACHVLPRFEMSTYVRGGEELALSGRDLGALLEAVVSRGAPFRFRAKGSSMTPFIRDGDIVTVSPIKDRPPRPGDVVAFARPGSRKLVVHRVVGRREAGWLIKGDSYMHAEGPIPRDHVLGRVTRVERGGRRVLVGLGPERLLIPWLSHHQRLFSALRAVWRSGRRIVRRGR